MANNNIVMNEQEFELAASAYSNSSTNVSTAGADAPSKFTGAINAGLLGDSIGAITNQLSMISASISNVQGIMTKHSNEMFTYDRTMAKMAEEIEIPTDFLANDSAEVNQYARTLLGKIDGTSVNEGQTAKEFKEIDESTVSAEGLRNITGQDAKEEVYDDSSVVGKSILGNITSGDTVQQTYDDSVSVQGSALADINNNQTEQQTYDDSVSVQGSKLSNISGNQTEQKEYDESTVIGKSILGQVNSNNATKQQELDVTSAIAAAQNLADMSNGSAGKAYDEVMIDTQNLASTAFAGMVNSQDVENKKKKVEEEIERVNYDEFESHQ